MKLSELRPCDLARLGEAVNDRQAEKEKTA